MAKFKKGQTITAIIRGTGLEEATIQDIVEYKGRMHYKCSILKGIALIPLEAEPCYKIKE